MDPKFEAQIRTRAYKLWENDASPHGRADEYWEMALRQLEAEGAVDAPTEPVIEQSSKGRSAEPIPDRPEDAG